MGILFFCWRNKTGSWTMVLHSLSLALCLLKKKKERIEEEKNRALYPCGLPGCTGVSARITLY